MKKRISKDEYYWNIAREVSKRGTCLSAFFGAVIVNNDAIVTTGYVGAPRKTQSCNDRGECLRRKIGVPSGQRYELCASVHSEQNAIINAAREGASTIGSTMYLYGAKYSEDGKEKLFDAYPCFICKKMIINAGVKKLVSNDSKGNLRTFEINDWIKEWQKHSLLEDKEIYRTDEKYLQQEEQFQITPTYKEGEPLRSKIFYQFLNYVL